MPSASPPHCLVRRLRSSGSKQGCMFESLFCSGLWLNSSVSTTGYRTRAGKVEPSLSFELSERRRHLGLWNLSDCQLLEVPTQTDKLDIFQRPQFHVPWSVLGRLQTGLLTRCQLRPRASVLPSRPMRTASASTVNSSIVGSSTILNLEV